MTEAIRLTTGDPAPTFTLPTDTGDQLSLSDLRGRKVILYVYPSAMTPGCTKQACDFRDSLASLTAAGYDVVGISPDTPAKLAKFREHDALTFPLVSDQDRSVLTAYAPTARRSSTARPWSASSAPPSSSTRRAPSSRRSTTSRPPATSPSSARTWAWTTDRKCRRDGLAFRRGQVSIHAGSPGPSCGGLTDSSTMRRGTSASSAPTATAGPLPTPTANAPVNYDPGTALRRTGNHDRFFALRGRSPIGSRQTV